MSDLARLTIDLALRLEASGIVALGEAEPSRLAEIESRIPVQRSEISTPPSPQLVEEATGALLTCDLALEQADDPAELLGAVSTLLDVAVAGVISIADRDLLGAAAADDGVHWNAEQLLALLEQANIAVDWVGLTDAAGSLGRRAGITCVVSRSGEAARAALAGGALGLGFDSAVAGAIPADRSRVCIVSYEFAGLTRTGGIGTAYTSLAETLAAGGQQVTVLFTGWEDKSADPFSRWVRHYRKLGIALERLPQEIPDSIETAHPHAVRAYQAYRWLALRDDDFDVVHFPEVLGHGYYAIEAKRLGVGLQRTTIAVGTHSSTSWVLESNGTLYQALNDFADDYIERCCVARCDALISPSAYMLDWMRARGWKLPERHFVQQYARSGAVAKLALEHPPATADADADEPQLPEIVFFGRLEPRKGLRVFCDALDQLAAEAPPQVRVTFLGKQSSIDGILAAEYIDGRRASWPWATTVIDDLGQPEAVAYLRSAGRRITVIPSLADNSPNTVYEALALELPFIASRVGGTAELLDPRDLAAATFDPEAERPWAAQRGAITLAERLRTALAAPPRVPRASVAADDTRAAHIDWHRAAAVVVAEAPPRKPLGSEALSVCLIGTDHELLAQSRLAIQMLHGRRPAELIEVAAAAEAAPEHELVLLIPAGAVIGENAIETLERSFKLSGADVITLAVQVSGSTQMRVPVGGPPIAGLLRRGLGDAAVAIRTATLSELGGIERQVEPRMQLHHLLCKAAVAGIEIRVLPEPMIWVPEEALSPMSIIDAAHAETAVLDVFSRAPAAVLGGLPRLTQQLGATAIEREKHFEWLMANRFGRFTLPIRRNVARWRHTRAHVRRHR